MKRDAAPFADSRPLVVHVVHRFAVGGLENGVANLINGMPDSRFRHAVLAMTEVTDFKARIVREDVAYFELRKPAGHALRCYPQLVRRSEEHTSELQSRENLVCR